MALQSQTARGGSATRYSDSSRGGKSTNKQVIGFVLLGALVMGAGYWYMNGRGGGGGGAARGVGPVGEVATDPTPTVRSNVGGATPVVSGAPVAVKPSATPATIDMGGGRDGRGIPAQAQAQTPPPGPGAAPGSSPSVAPGSGAGHALPAQAQPSVRDPLMAPGAGAGGSVMPAEVAALVTAGEKAKGEGRLLDARKQFNAALLNAGTSGADRAVLRQKMAEINETLVFSKAIAPGDALAESYTVEKGDSLVKIARKKQTVSEPGLIARINGMPKPDALRVGQTLKLVRGPFHAVVSKSAFRMDIYEGPAPSTGSIGASGLAEGAEAGWTYIRSFSVGLGERGVTPSANFVVKENSKLVNPFWVNPRTGEKFDADDPKNPIGERWIGLEGVNLKDKAFTGYGVHGTIDPQSIGREMSMGCVRLGQADVELVYELLMPRVSVVKIVE